MDSTTNLLSSIILIIITYFLYNRLFGSWNYWTSRGIPSLPRPLPVFGNTFSVFRMRENLSMFCKKIYDSHTKESMIGFYSYKNPILMIKDVELVKTVMQTKFNYFQLNEAQLDLKNDPLMGRDLFFVHGQAWKDMRSIFVTTVSSKRIKIMSAEVEKVCERLNNHLTEKFKNMDNRDLEAKLLFSRYTTEVAAAVILGIEGNSFVDDIKGTLLESMKKIMDPSWMISIKHHIGFFFPSLSGFMKIRFVPLEVDEHYREIVKQVENMRQKNDASRNDVLQLLLDLEKQEKIPHIEVLAQSFSFFLESYETSSLTLSFVFYLLAKHEKVQNLLRHEVNNVLAKHEGRLTYEAVNEMKYAEQVINETMRLFPAGGTLSKVCAESCRLEGSDGLIANVESGSTILISTLGLHMDPEYWDNPEEFNPDRFDRKNDDAKHRFVFLPFGEGPRACPGQRFGIFLVKAAMATVVKNYIIESSPRMLEPIRMDPKYFMSTASGGFWIRLRALKNN